MINWKIRILVYLITFGLVIGVIFNNTNNYKISPTSKKSNLEMYCTHYEGRNWRCIER